MAQWEIHYEIYARQGAEGGWNLLGVARSREAALSMAQDYLSQRQTASVKVVKETYDPETGAFLSLKIFEEGHARLRLDPAAEDVPHALPCLAVEDLYAAPARATLARVLSDFLVHHRLTVTELIHRADMLERLETSGTVYQHAVQKIALTQASTTKLPIHPIMKGLDKLATDAMQRVYRDMRRGYFAGPAQGGLSAFAERIGDAADADYRLSGALAFELAQVESWKAKLGRLLELLDDVPAAGGARARLFRCIDSIAAELLHTPSALRELLGTAESLGAEMTIAIELFLGNPSDALDACEELKRLAGHFARDDLPQSRGTVVQRIMAELRSMRRLCPASFAEELRAVRGIAARLVHGEGEYLSREDINAAFVLRSRRLVSLECVEDYLALASSPDEKLERLLAIEENIVGTPNKRQLAAYTLPLVTSPQFEAQFLSPATPVAARLKRIAELQGRLRRCGLDDAQRGELAGILDRIASEAEARAKLLESVVSRHADVAERVIALLKVCVSGVLTEGKLSAKARHIILSNVNRPGFFTSYIGHMAREGRNADAEKAMADLLQTLEQVGISHQDGLAAIAA